MELPVYPPVSVVLQAYNEETAVRSQVESIRRVLCAAGITHEIIVVDDGSHDQTAVEALQACARLLRHPLNRGYGASLKTGIAAATNDTIVIIDADGTYPAASIPALLAQLAAADMVVGARTGAQVHVPSLRRPAKRVLGWLATRIAGCAIPDVNSGLRVFRRGCVQQYFPLLPNRFSFTTTVTLALLADDYRVRYVPIDYHRRMGQSKITPGHFVEFLLLVLRMAILFQPLKVFMPFALACGTLGGLKVLFDLVALWQRTPTVNWALFYQPVISTSAILLLLMALQLLLIGMVADGVLRRLLQLAHP